MQKGIEPIIAAGAVVALAIMVAGVLAGLGVEQEVAPTPMPPIATPMPTPEPEPCDFDGYCDVNETIEGCPDDCIPSTGLDAERNETSEYPSDTTPTITVTMQDPQGIQTCGVSPTDVDQWECIVKSPGEIVSEVDCTLLDYELDGKYAFVLRCKDGQGDNVTPVLVDDVIICADPMGCAR